MYRNLSDADDGIADIWHVIDVFLPQNRELNLCESEQNLWTLLKNGLQKEMRGNSACTMLNPVSKKNTLKRGN